MVRNENNIAEMVTRQPTIIAQINLISQKTWQLGGHGQFSLCTKALKPMVREENNLAEMVAR